MVPIGPKVIVPSPIVVGAAARVAAGLDGDRAVRRTTSEAVDADGHDETASAVTMPVHDPVGALERLVRVRDLLVEQRERDAVLGEGQGVAVERRRSAPGRKAEIHASWAMSGSSHAISVDIIGPTTRTPSVRL